MFKKFIFVKRLLASSKLFWKYRHFLQINFFLKNYGNLPKKHFDLIFKKVQSNVVLDFGCATGDKLIYFVNKGAKNVYGIDINHQAIQTAKKNLKKYEINCQFSDKLIIYNLKKFLNKNKKFDLVLFERVLYILNDKEFYYIISKLSKLTKYIYIDDFFLDEFKKKLRVNIKGYKHSNFITILNNMGFYLLSKNNSPYQNVLFANTKSALFIYRK